jgi:hypothetical protein
MTEEHASKMVEPLLVEFRKVNAEARFHGKDDAYIEAMFEHLEKCFPSPAGGVARGVIVRVIC